MDKKLKATIKYIIDIKRVNSVTPKKLQKLLYYVQAWHLALTAENNTESEINRSLLFNSEFEAWVHGPVIPEVYEEYKSLKASVIEFSGFDDENLITLLNDDELANINDVLDTYGSFNGSDLEALSHDEAPWREARNGLGPLDSSNKAISNKTMFEYYSARLV
ncbi:DUF4065 domain-containing protein [Streptococcus parauberis]|uniref:DUF4065 domain-containing protein n=1 Tax=Streptococcus parauberis TaxID=1348 RepID=A0AAE4KZS4_9STRE|nr:type II toxin-antitoxin system antitoxin SocA domain-containing protein [Streptococcus parauberis]MDT2731069.1 DUF4065 domain-containing protein [Streptococcus parauberis]MDT2749809.1 DUF4065 domain-containing protein [Streptococcus parauberis]